MATSTSHRLMIYTVTRLPSPSSTAASPDARHGSTGRYGSETVVPSPLAEIVNTPEAVVAA
jgi:hypothetical protein